MQVSIPPVGVGFIIALIVFIVAIVFLIMGADPKVMVMIAAVALARMLP